MWRRVCSCGFLKQSVSSAATKVEWKCKFAVPPLPILLLGIRPFESSSFLSPYVTNCNYNNYNSNATANPFLNNNNNNNNKSVSFSTTTSGDDSKPKSKSNVETITFTEAKKLMRLVNVEALKTKLGMEGKEVISYNELLAACESMGVARSIDEAVAFARVLDEAGVVLLFRDKVYLHPDKVVDLVRRAVPLALHPEDDPVRDELKKLQEKKEEIDVLAHKQVRCMLWTALGLAMIHIGLFFRLTFWEFSWDVMEPIAFFTTTSGVMLGYAYFMFTSRDPTYQDLLKRLFLSRQRKLFKKYNFDVNRFRELQSKCKIPLDARASIKNRTGLELELEDALHD